MKKLSALISKLGKDESGQGATEYILLLVVVVAISFLFKDKIKSVVQAKLEELAGSIQSFNGNN